MASKKVASREGKSVQKVAEKRTPEEIFKGVRSNAAARLGVTSLDILFVLGAHDAEKEFSHKLAEENVVLKNEKGQLLIILNAADDGLKKTREERNDLARQVVDLQTKLDEFRAVYEQENRSTTLRVDVLTPATADPDAAL